ncbi:MAG: thermonuclease family protein [Parcubacteria group bacterium]|jgi:micrococcal nuclease
MSSILKKAIPLIIMLAILYMADRMDLPQVEEGSADIPMETHHVTHIVDGDTFDIETGERVRMIGMDTPERGKPYYAEATAHLKSLIEDKDVILKKDVSEKDRYGRLLRHVYVGEQWVNKTMIEDGYARLVTYPPDVAHVQDFKEAETRARETESGIWSIDGKNAYAK